MSHVTSLSFDDISVSALPVWMLSAGDAGVMVWGAAADSRRRASMMAHPSMEGKQTMGDRP